MIVIQYIEPSGSDPLFTMTLAKGPNGFPLNCEALVSLGIPLAGRCVPVDIGNFTDYRPFLSTDPRARASGELLTQLGRLEIPITESSRSQDESSKRVRTID
jgi:hypothetical protein